MCLKNILFAQGYSKVLFNKRNPLLLKEAEDGSCFISLRFLFSPNSLILASGV